MNNALYLRRRSRILLPEAEGEGLLPLNLVATLVKNLEPLGYGFSERLVHACRALSEAQLTDLYLELLVELTRKTGAHRQHRPMYPNFPEEVMEMSECELYLNALFHYWTDGQYLPESEVKERYPLLDNPALRMIDLGTREEFEGLFRQIAGANSALSEQDQEDLAWFVRTYGDAIGPLLPEAVPQKENTAFLAGLLMANTESAVPFISRFVRTATDVLRLAVALSGGDVSLAQSTRFRTFSRPERRLLLALLEEQENAVEDMLRWKERWLRLGEKLHPGEYAERYPRVSAAFQQLRNEKVITFYSHVEQALAARDVAGAVARLGKRPGDLARRLDHLLRLDDGSQEAVLSQFAEVAGRVSTPVLLQVREHFRSRGAPAELRVFFPKGSLARAQAVPNTLPPLPSRVAARVAEICEAALLERFRGLPPLGRVYVDPELRSYMVPFGTRSASRSLRTLVRGSRLPLPDRCPVLRFFVWWKNGKERTDLDLSATMFDAEFNYVDILSYYNLKGFGGHHSGDIVDAPEGASEFIDVTLDRLRERKVRYVVMTLTSYTRQPYVELPECFAGWMARERPNSGEIFEPKTVVDRVDLTADSQIAIPLIIDVDQRRVIWVDLSLRSHPRWFNNVHANLKGVQLSLRSLVDLRKPNLYDLFCLHIRARGERVNSPEQAETVFSVENETPYRLETIAAEYLQ